MSEEMFKLFEHLEERISPERKVEMDQAGKTVCQFLLRNSSDAVESHIENLKGDEQTLFFAAALWDYYRFTRRAAL
jgi:hypothetical protein